MISTVLIFLAILSVLVLVHELGHFFAAKLFKIKVEEFGFGLPPRVFGFKYGETLYSINWLPIGGFVKLYGEDEAGSGKVSIKAQKTSLKDANRAFFSKPAWQRMVVIVAGVFMNFVLAVALISYLFAAVGVPVPTDKVVVSAVIKGAPAEIAGLTKGQVIESINGKVVKSPQDVLDTTRANLGKVVEVKVLTEEGSRQTIKLTPRKDYPKNQGPMGVAIEEVVKITKYPWYEAPFVGTKEALKMSWLIVTGLSTLVTQLIFQGVIPRDVAGPIGIAELTGEVAKIGPFAILSFVSLLSLNLAIINILPIPALDGGRLFFIVIETITRRKINPKVEGYAHSIGMAILLLLIALITFHDLFRIFSGQSILPK